MIRRGLGGLLSANLIRDSGTLVCRGSCHDRYNNTVLNYQTNLLILIENAYDGNYKDMSVLNALMNLVSSLTVTHQKM